MNNSRSANTMRNLLYAWFVQSFTLIMNMVVRVIFVRMLSKDYVGIGSLFNNIINLLSIAELGVGGAIVYSLYLPLSNNDVDKVKSLMDFYQKVYTCIGVLIGLMGISLSPFLFWFIEDMPDIAGLNLIYILYVLNASVSYFFSYKASLVTADQKDYILKKLRIKVMMVMYLLQIIVLLLFRSYLLFLIIQVIFTVILNYVFSRKADELYPFLKDKNKVKLEGRQFQTIVKNTKALMFHKIGTIMVFSTDNLIISKYTGLGNIANYSNYLLIQETLNGVLMQFFSAMSASVGNLVAADEQKSILIFNRVFMLNAVLYGFCSVCFLGIAQEFIFNFFGEDYLVSNTVLFIIVLNFYITGMRKTVQTFRDAYGLFWQNRYMPIAESLMNLFISIILVQKYGVAGVLFGTTLSSLFFPVWMEPYILFRYGFHRKIIQYWQKYLKYVLLTVGVGLITWGGCSIIPYIPIVSLIVKAVISVLIASGMFYLLLKRDNDFEYYAQLVSGIVKVKLRS